MNTFYVSIGIESAAQLIDDEIVKGSITGTRIDAYQMKAPQDKQCIVLVYEKHFVRAGNRLTLTVVLDDFEGRTRVHTIGGGGGSGLFRFDMGASKSFARAAEDALLRFIVR